MRQLGLGSVSQELNIDVITPSKKLSRYLFTMVAFMVFVNPVSMLFLSLTHRQTLMLPPDLVVMESLCVPISRVN